MRISIRHDSNYIIEFDQFVANGRLGTGGYAFTFTMRGGRQACETPISIFDISLSLSLSDPTRPLKASYFTSAHKSPTLRYVDNHSMDSSMIYVFNRNE
jgi:hypothetical protein